MLDILKRIAIGVAVGMSIFFLKGAIKVHAYANYETYKTDSILDSATTLSGSLTSDSTTRVYKAFDSPHKIVDSKVNAIQINVSYSTSYAAISSGSPSNINFQQIINETMVYLNADSSITDSNGNFCAGISGVSTGTGYIFYPQKGCRYVGITFYIPFQNYSAWVSGARYRIFLPTTWTYLSIVSDPALSSITDGTDQSGSGNSYDNSGVTSNTNKEDTLTQNAEQDISSFNIDFSTISSGFQYLLDLFSNICQANVKLFGMILSLLGFGFIGLVLGR